MQIAGRTVPEVEEGTAVVLPADPTAKGLVIVEPGSGMQALESVDVVFPVLHGASARTARSRACSRWPASRMSGRRVRQRRGDGQGVHQEAAARRRPRRSAVRGRAAPRRRFAAEISRTSGCPCSSNRRAPARASASPRSPTGTSCGGAASAFEHDAKVLVEAAVSGREIECGVLECRTARPRRACPPRSGSSAARWYDFEAKYLDDACEFDVPAQLLAEPPRDSGGRVPRVPRP